jgi:hypothetical protein
VSEKLGYGLVLLTIPVLLAELAAVLLGLAPKGFAISDRNV